MKKLIVFDLDGTLAEGNSPLDGEMATLLSRLLSIVKVAIISNHDWSQFEKQILQSDLSQSSHLENLSLLPICGTKFYEYESGWKELYSEEFTAGEKESIIDALQEASAASGFRVSQRWGEVIEDRGSQITYSALGPNAPVGKKREVDSAKRSAMKARLDQRIPGFCVSLGDTGSIDVTKLGIDKAYGVRKLHENRGIELDGMFFIGETLFPGENDDPERRGDFLCFEASDPEETKRLIEAILVGLECAIRMVAKIGPSELGERAPVSVVEMG